MKSRMLLSAMALLVAIATHGLLAEDAAKEKKEIKCPVSGKAINKDASREFGGGKVYFCCNNCPAAFEADTAKFKAKANLQLAQTEQIKEITCPLTGKALNPNTELTISDVKVTFCCNNCKGAVAKMTEDEQVDKVFGDISKHFEVVKK